MSVCEEDFLLECEHSASNKEVDLESKLFNIINKKKKQ